jgi:hypothetical protein
MPFKNTNTKAYDNAGKYPRFIRSTMYKVFKTIDRMQGLNLSHSQNRLDETVHTPNTHSKKTTVTNSKVELKKTEKINTHFMNSMIEYSVAIPEIHRQKIDDLTSALVSEIKIYIIDKAISYTSKTIHIMIDVGKIVISIVHIYQERDCYEVIAEILEGETSLSKNYEPLRDFFNLHVDLLKNISTLTKSLAQ